MDDKGEEPGDLPRRQQEILRRQEQNGQREQGVQVINQDLQNPLEQQPLAAAQHQQALMQLQLDNMEGGSTRTGATTPSTGDDTLSQLTAMAALGDKQGKGMAKLIAQNGNDVQMITFLRRPYRGGGGARALLLAGRGRRCNPGLARAPQERKTPHARVRWASIAWWGTLTPPPTVAHPATTCATTKAAVGSEGIANAGHPLGQGLWAANWLALAIGLRGLHALVSLGHSSPSHMGSKLWPTWHLPCWPRSLALRPMALSLVALRHVCPLLSAKHWNRTRWTHVLVQILTLCNF